MKLTKVSLAALVALGAFSSVASATPLEEAIKNVDMTGFARYRYTNTKTTTTDGETGISDKGTTDAAHNFKSVINFKAAFDDRFFGVLGIRYNSSDKSGNNGDATDTTKTFAVNEAYLGYTAQNTTVTFGRQQLGTFFTDDEAGTGLKIVNTDITGLTLAAVVFDGLENSSESDGGLLAAAKAKPAKIKATVAGNMDITYKQEEAATPAYNTGNLYGVAAIGSYDPVSFQLWYASLEHVADLFAVEVAGDVAVSDDMKFGLKGQFVNSDADKRAKKAFEAVDYNDGHFYAFEASTDLFGANVATGYLAWKAKGYGATSLSFEDQGSLISPAQQFSDYFDYTLIAGKGSFFFANAGYTFDKFFAGVDYVQGNLKDDEGNKVKYKEGVVRASYKYSKKLKFSTWYSVANTKDSSDGDKTKSDKYRFEAKYSF